MRSLSFFRFMINLEQSRSRIQKLWFKILKFSSITTFFYKQSRTKKILRNSYAIALSKGTILGKNCWFFAKKYRLQQNLEVPGKLYFLKLRKCAYL